MPVRFALVGYGEWGKCHGAALRDTPGADLRAVWSRSTEALKEAKRELRTDATDNFDRLLRRTDLDAADVVLPNCLHHEAALSVLQSKRHLLLESPPGLSVQQCDEITAAARRTGCVVGVGLSKRFSPLWSKVKEMVDSGWIGEPVQVIIDLWRRPYSLGRGGWRYFQEQVGSWLFQDPMHLLDLACWLLARTQTPTSAFAEGRSSDVKHPEFADNLTMILNFTGNSVATITCALSVFEHHLTLRVVGTEGALVGQWSGGDDPSAAAESSLVHYTGRTLKEVALPGATDQCAELAAQIAAFVRAIEKDMAFSPSLEDGRRTLQLCLAVEESMKEGRVIELQ